MYMTYFIDVNSKLFIFNLKFTFEENKYNITKYPPGSLSSS